jgi:hypothetical protein
MNKRQRRLLRQTVLLFGSGLLMVFTLLLAAGPITRETPQLLAIYCALFLGPLFIEEIILVIKACFIKEES